jgi:hypothetical protein
MKRVIRLFDGLMLLAVVAASVFCLTHLALNTHTPSPPQAQASAYHQVAQSTQRTSGNGGQASPASATSTTQANDDCSGLSQFSIDCIESGIATWLAQNIVNGLNPITQIFVNDPLDVVFHTSDQLTYNNGTVIAIAGWVEGIVDSALVIFVIIAGYNVMRGAAQYYENMRTLPALGISVVAAHFALSLAGPLIEINNGICDYLRQQISVQLLATFIENVFSRNFEGNWVLYVLSIVLSLLAFAVVAEMFARVAVIDLFLIFISAWTVAWGLRQAEFVARPCTRAFLVTVFIQAIQVGALGLGALLFASFQQLYGQLNGVDAAFAQELLAIAVLYLVLRLPQMLGAALVLREATDAVVRVPQQAGQAAFQAVKLAATLA